jgi:hypothetical protein
MKHLICHFLLHVVSTEFQTSRSAARHWKILYKSPLLDSYLHNLPSSAKSFLILETQGYSEMLTMTLLLATWAVTNKTILQMYFILLFYYLTPCTRGEVWRLWRQYSNREDASSFFL